MTLSVGTLLFEGRDKGDRMFSSREKVGRRESQQREARPQPRCQQTGDLGRSWVSKRRLGVAGYAYSKSRADT